MRPQVVPPRLTVDDDHGSVGQDIVLIKVVDTTPPVIACPAPMTVPCSLEALLPVTFPSPLVSDKCDPGAKVTCSPASGSLFSVGDTTVTCTATDADGNTATCTFTVTRQPLAFQGFLAPVSGADATGGTFSAPVRAFKLGSTIPVKFNATCQGTAVITGVHKLEAIKYSSAVTGEPPIDASPGDAATLGNQFRLVDNQWQFNLDTKETGMSVGTWQLLATLSDSSQHSVWIQVK